MKRYVLSLLLLSLAACAQAAPEHQLPRADGSKTPVRLYGDWASCQPTVILSPGLGGNDEHLRYIGEALASHGYRALVMGHSETGFGALAKTIVSEDHTVVLLDQSKYDARFMDIDAALALATQNCRPQPLVLAGHSMGASTTMLEAGAKGAMKNAGRDRFDGYIALSPQGQGYMFHEGSWKSVRKPVLMITGTEDSGLDGKYTKRLDAFEGLPPGQKRFVIIDGASHLNFDGLGNEKAQNITVDYILEYLEMLKTGKWKRSNITQADVREK